MEQENKDQTNIPMPPLTEEELEEGTEEVQEEVQEEIKEQPIKKVDDRETNMRKLREEKERIEREHQEALRRLAEYENKKQPVEEENLDIDLNDDDLFEGRHYKKIKKQLQRQQEELKKYQEQVKTTKTETKLRSQFSDFDTVLTPENIKRLRETEPEIADTIASNNDIYTKAVSAYKMIKKLGIYVEDEYDKERLVAQRNSLKPKPLVSVSPQQGDSPLARANAFADGLTQERKDQLWKEMNEASNNY